MTEHITQGHLSQSDIVCIVHLSQETEVLFSGSL